MQIEHYALIILAVTVFLLLLLANRRKGKHLSEVSQLKEAADEYKTQMIEELVRLRKLSDEYKKQGIEEAPRLKASSDEYKKQVMANLRETLPYGETVLAQCFKKLFDDPAFGGYTFYNHLTFETEQGFKQVDYFIVSPKGMFVIESKRWSGVTYIYTNGFQDLFRGTAYDDFSGGSSEKIKVFNAQRSKDRSGQIVLSAYQNPIAQARGYSRYLVKLLNAEQIKNVVIFNVSDGFSVLYNNAPLSKAAVDKFTSVITDTCITDYFNGLPDHNYDMGRINTLINSQFHYRFKIDQSNYKQEPINSL